MDSLHPAVATTVKHFSNPEKSLKQLGLEEGISKQAVKKRIALATIHFEAFGQKKTKDPQLEILKKENERLSELHLELRRQLIIAQTNVFLLNLFKKKVLKFFPKFKLSRFEADEKKIPS